MSSKSASRPMPGVPGSSEMRIVVPGSTANLGSGFDALGLALSLYDTVDVHVVDGAPGAVQVSVDGEGAGVVPTDERHLIARVLYRTLEALHVEAPALDLRCVNTIPHSRGLGSSAAAIVSGVVAAHAIAGISLRDKENRDRALDLAADHEGHADNVAASLLGGLVIAWGDDERFRATRLEPHARLRPIALVPAGESSTHTTRGLLPDTVPHSDATFAAGRAALAVRALTSEPELALAATEDRLHQEYREPAWPETVALVRRLRAAGVAAAVSGAGPTVLALPVDEDLASGQRRAGGGLLAGVDTSGFEVYELSVDGSGARVEQCR